MTVMQRFTFFLAIGLALFSLVGQVAAADTDAVAVGKRLALVAGNDNYRDSKAKLFRARADAAAMASSLRDLGFEVDEHLDVDKRKFEDVLLSFKKKASAADEVLIYFAGHAVQFEGKNFLMTLDLRLLQERANVYSASVTLAEVSAFQDKKPSITIIILDACRDDPFTAVASAPSAVPLGASAGQKTIGRNLVVRLGPVRVTAGDAVIYGAGSGQIALDRLGRDDSDRNGLFARVFLREMVRPGQSLRQSVNVVRTELARLAEQPGSRVNVAFYDEMVGDYYFVRGNKPAVPVAILPTGTGASPPVTSGLAEFRDCDGDACPLLGENHLRLDLLRAVTASLVSLSPRERRSQQDNKCRNNTGAERPETLLILVFHRCEQFHRTNLTCKIHEYGAP